MELGPAGVCLAKQRLIADAWRERRAKLTEQVAESMLFNVGPGQCIRSRLSNMQAEQPQPVLFAAT